MLRALIDGRSDTEAMELVEQVEKGAGERARQLIEGLAAGGALSWTAPARSKARWQVRRQAAIWTGVGLNLFGSSARRLPISVLAWFFWTLPSTAITQHVWRSRRNTILRNMRASGFAGRPEQDLMHIGLGSASCAPANGLFAYLSATLGPPRLAQLAERLFDRGSADRLSASLHRNGPVVGVFLHGPLCVAVPNILRNRGHEVVRTITGHSHGTNVSERSGPLLRFFGDPPEKAVEVNHALATAELVRHLKAGRSVHIALEIVPGQRNSGNIMMLGNRFQRNDGPAWLAVRSGRPVTLWTTHRSRSRLVIQGSAPLYPDPALPVERRVAELSERLYQEAETAIREHPDAWGGWGYLSLISGSEN
jgi:lauroyl/myristoyl acyltransferase